MTAPVNRYYVLTVQASGERAPHIRHILAAHLRYWGLEKHIRPVCRAVHELFRNVAEHAGDDKTCVVELRWNGSLLTAAVSDRGTTLPRLLGPSLGGLATVAALSDTWGACPTPEGKIVWFSRRATSDDTRPLVAHRPTSTPPAAHRAPHGVPS